MSAHMPAFLTYKVQEETESQSPQSKGTQGEVTCSRSHAGGCGLGPGGCLLVTSKVTWGSLNALLILRGPCPLSPSTVPAGRPAQSTALAWGHPCPEPLTAPLPEGGHSDFSIGAQSHRGWAHSPSNRSHCPASSTCLSCLHAQHCLCPAGRPGLGQMAPGHGRAGVTRQHGSSHSQAEQALPHSPHLGRPQPRDTPFLLLTRAL